jgi:DNA (cytosine-5)-methyltransferase 1
MREMIVDVFAGGGGASLGIEQALGVPVDLAINHDEEAMAMHWLNHPHTRHGCADVWSVDPCRAMNGVPVGLAWFSPDCTHFSRAKGGQPVERRIRSLAWVVIKWARAVRPRVIILENVPEFREWGPLGADDRPDPARKGTTWHLWCNRLRGLGYEVQSRELKACYYGAPTIRKRLFVIARCDGAPIVWPEPSHGPGRIPYRTAAECIDWSLPCPSIFLALEEAKKWGVRRPLAEKTLERIARGIRKFVLESVLVGVGGRAGQSPERPASEPNGTVTGKNDRALAVATLIETGYGERQGQAPRAPGLEKPLGTVVGTGKHALVGVSLMTNTSGHAGSAADSPVPTLTTGDHQYAVASFLSKLYGTTTGSDLREPLPTVTGQGNHVAEVRAFLMKYYGRGTGQDCRAPLHTAKSRATFGLVIVAGQDYQIADIGLRMLTPRELARAQGFPDAYHLMGTKSNQVSKIGNSVCPPLAEALVRVNVHLREIVQPAEVVA